MKKSLRKWLSLFLAVVMAVTGLSVGFSALAAESDPNDPYLALADALKAEGVQTAVWPSAADGCAVSVDDPTGDITQAAEAFWQLVADRYQDDYRGKTYSASGVYGDEYTMWGVKSKIADALQNDRYAMGAYWAQAERALNCFIAYQNGAQEMTGAKSLLEKRSYPSAPKSAAYTFTVSQSVRDRLLAAEDLADLPDTLYTDISYRWQHDGQNLYADTAVSGRWIKVTYYTGHRNLVWTESSRTAGEDSETVPALKAFAAYFTAERLSSDLTAMRTAELEKICADGQACINALGSLWNDDAVMNHFLDKAAVEAFMADVQAACGQEPASGSDSANGITGGIGEGLDLSGVLDQPSTQSVQNPEDDLIAAVVVTIVAAVLLTAASVGAYFLQPLISTMKINVDPDKEYQTIDGFGSSACWWSQYAGASENAEEISELLFGESGLGLNIYRYNIGAGEADNPNSPITNPWRRTESFYYYNEKTGRWEYDFSRDAAAQEMLRLSLAKEVDTVVLFANSPHYSMTISGTAAGHVEQNTANLAPENYDAYVDYFLDITEYFLEQGVPVKYISPINEPQWSWSSTGGSQEGTHYEPEEMAELLSRFAKAIEERGLNVTLMGPESGEIGETNRKYMTLLKRDKTLYNAMDSFAYHSYWKDDDPGAKLQFGLEYAARWNGKKLHMTEWCELPNTHVVSDFGGALVTARVISDDLTLSGAGSWSAWTGMNQRSSANPDEDYSDGLLTSNDDCSEYSVTMRYYALAHFSKYIEPGAVRIQAAKSGYSDTLRVSGFKNPDGSRVIVLVNEGEETAVRLQDEAQTMQVITSTSEKQLETTFDGAYSEKLTLPGSSITTVILK